MTTTTVTSSLSSTPHTTSRLACMDHGMLAADAVVCPRCGSKPWSLDNAEHATRMATYLKTVLKGRVRNFAIVAGVASNLVVSLLRSIAEGGLHLEVSLTPSLFAAAVGAGLAWAFRPRAVHALERNLKRR